VGNKLFALYFKLGSDFKETRRVCDEIIVKEDIAWLSMISGYIKAGEPRSSLDMFLEMLGFGVEPTAFDLSAMIKACLEIGDLKLGRLKQGKEVHANVVTSSLCGDVVIKNNLVDMYEKCGSVAASRHVFDKKLVKDYVSWSALLVAYYQNRDLEYVIKLFR
ncbi:PPR domain-containing protein, partial [Cephalotus follicularis]